MNEHRFVEKLLPWYANGTLDAEDMTRVANHLKTCTPCQSSVDTELRVSRAFQAEPPALGRLMATQEKNVGQLLQSIIELDRPRFVIESRHWLPLAVSGEPGAGDARWRLSTIVAWRSQ